MKPVTAYLDTRELNLLNEKGMLGKGRTSKFSGWVREQIFREFSDDTSSDELDKQRLCLKEIEIKQAELETEWKLAQKRIIELEGLKNKNDLRRKKVELLGISEKEYKLLLSIKEEQTKKDSFSILRLRYNNYKLNFNKELDFPEFRKMIKEIQ